MSAITIHLNGLADDLIPVHAERLRGWWELDSKTAGHAHHCLPLLMANSLGYYILSPGSFGVAWDGDWDSDAFVDPIDGGEDFVVDNHSAHGSFTVQPGFIPTTSRVGDFILIRGIANRRQPWFNVMEGLIEAWWQPGEFALVCTLNRPGHFVVRRGEPLAQMAIYRAEGGFATLKISTALPVETAAWRERRGRPNYRKDFDYMRGRHPDGSPEPTHLRTWRAPMAEVAI
jgi:Family of unknown function (DUF6065)